MPTDKAFFYPEGVEGLFEIYYAPADTFETVNTLGLPLYARAIPDRERDEWVRLEIESNPLPICTRPQVLRSRAADLMSAFAAAVDALFADPNLAREATYEPADGDPFPVRVIARRADAVTEFGERAALVGDDALRSAGERGRDPAAGRPARPRRRDLRRPGRAGARPRAAGLDARREAGMKLKLDIQPDLVAMMAAEIAAGERAVTAAMREAGTGLKLAWRGQIVGAGLGPRLANSIRSEVFPKAGASLNAAAVVWSKAPVIVGAHDAGPLIRSKNGFWLAIPTPAAGKALGGRRITPGGLGAEDRAAAAVRLSPDRAEPARGGQRAAQHARARGGVALEDRARAGHRADLPAGAAGQAAEAARSGAGRRAGARAVPGLIVANWVEASTVWNPECRHCGILLPSGRS